MMSERNDDETVLEGSGNVFADLVLQMSDDDMLKVVIARAITRIVHAGRYTQKAAAEIMHTDQPKVSKLLRGRLKEFSSKWLIERLLLLGYDMEIGVKKSVSRERGRINLAA